MVSYLKNNTYDKCWLRFEQITDCAYIEEYTVLLSHIYFSETSNTANTACNELLTGITQLFGTRPEVINYTPEKGIIISLTEAAAAGGFITEGEKHHINAEGYIIKSLQTADREHIVISAKSGQGLVYGVFHFLRLIQGLKDLLTLNLLESPKNQLRMINHWDNMDGSVERGYAGRSIFYDNYQMTGDMDRIKDYTRLMASVGINGVVINNVNVHYFETKLIDDQLLVVEKLADVFRNYGIKTYLSINYASPIQLGGLDTADPLSDDVAAFWEKTATKIYKAIPDFGGFIVKADSENRPGPYTYNRNHADGANMLAKALKPYGGILIWRCFVYNCHQDWRDLTIDRAKAAYDNYWYLDGRFSDNVVLQIKNGPMDFQVREPVSPLFGAMEHTNQMLEFQITQEYTGQQRHLCYLVPQWKEILNFDTYAKGKGTPVKTIVDGSAFNSRFCGIAAVCNVGNDYNWTGHYLAQANLFGYGRLTWNPDLTAEEITEEWIAATYSKEEDVINTISEMLLSSHGIYENYTSPLGIGWMVNPNHHYGPSPDGYEYSKWGTYHRADYEAIGVDRTIAKGTGYTGQYFEENKNMFEKVESCPEELLLFFHRMPYTYKLSSGKAIIQHIYDTHFKGVNQAVGLKEKWMSLKDKMDLERYEHTLNRLEEQIEHAKEWRDVINSYFYRKTGISDEQSRLIP